MGHQDAAAHLGAPVPLLPVRGDAGGDAPSEPPSPASAQHDGRTLLLDGVALPDSSCGDGGGACWLTQGASEQEQAEGKRVRIVLALCACPTDCWCQQQSAAHLPAAPAAQLTPPCAPRPAAPQVQRKLVAALVLAFAFMLVEVGA